MPPAVANVVEPTVPARLMSTMRSVSPVSGAVSLASTLISSAWSSCAVTPSAAALGPSFTPVMVRVTAALACPPKLSAIV